MRAVEAGGLAFAVREWGEPGAPALLCRHGAGDDSQVTGGFPGLPFDPAARLRERVPEAEVRTVEAEGHDLLADEPGNVARPVGEWLAQR